MTTPLNCGERANGGCQGQAFCLAPFKAGTEETSCRVINSLTGSWSLTVARSLSVSDMR